MPPVRTSRIDHSAMPPGDTWRDVAAAYLVHTGLRLATATGRARMLHVLSGEWRALVGQEIERLAAHPAGCRPVDGPPRQAR